MCQGDSVASSMNGAVVEMKIAAYWGSSSPTYSPFTLSSSSSHPHLPNPLKINVPSGVRSKPQLSSSNRKVKVKVRKKKKKDVPLIVTPGRLVSLVAVSPSDLLGGEPAPGPSPAGIAAELLRQRPG